jgi:hypothetical protein
MSEAVNEVNDIMNNEGPVEEESTSEVAVESVEESAPSEKVDTEVDTEEVAVESSTVEDAPVSTQEVVQNVQEILSSTETNVSGNDLENRVKVLEERLEKLIDYFRISQGLNFKFQ